MEVASLKIKTEQIYSEPTNSPPQLLSDYRPLALTCLHLLKPLEKTVKDEPLNTGQDHLDPLQFALQV